ncbi:hypothetical protein M8J77_005163 [Diaphorina citri]|nr:hypothetical protein M8J77_005163 [Diaphorina citri]
MLCKHVQTSATHIKDIIRQKTANLSDTHKRLLQCSKNFAATFSNTSKLTNFITLHVALHKSGPTITRSETPESEAFSATDVPARSVSPRSVRRSEPDNDWRVYAKVICNITS